MPRSAVRPLRPTSLLAVLALTLALLTGLVAAPQPASAAELGNGAALVPGTPVSLTFANPDDVATFTLTVPAGKEPWIRVTELTGMVAQFTATSPTRFDAPRFLPGEPTQWWQLLSANTGLDDETATVTLSSNGLTGTVTFVVGLAGDVPVQLQPGVPTGVTVAGPADRPVLSFTADDQQQVRVTVSDVVVSAPTDAVSPPVARVLLGTAGPFPFPLQETEPGVWTGATTTSPGLQTLLVSLGGDRTGSLTVQVDVTPTPGDPLSYGAAPVTVPLDSPSRVRLLPFEAQGRVPTLVRVTGVRLQHPDGTDGVATVSLVRPGQAPVALGTVTGTTSTVLSTPAALTAGEAATLRVIGDGATTGVLDVRLVLDPGPDVTLLPGAPNAIVLPPGTPARRFALDVPDDGPVEVFVRDLVLGDPGGVLSALVTITDAGGRPVLLATLDSFSPQTAFGFDAAAGRYYFEVTPQASFLGDAVDAGLTATFYVAPVKLLHVQAAPGDDLPVTTTVAGEQVDVAVPVPAGRRLVARLVDQLWTQPDLGDGCCAQAGLRITDGAGNLLSGFGSFAETAVPFGEDRVLHVLVDPVGLATGSARLLLTSPSDVTGALPTGTPTTVTITEPGQNALLTLTGTAGRRLAVDVPAAALTTAGLPVSTGLTLLDPDGAEVASTFVTTGEPGWLETPVPLATTGTYTLRVDPPDDATGTIRLTATEPRVVTAPIASGTTRTLTFGRGDVVRLTFRGRAGQRPVLQVPTERQTVETGVQLLDPAGNPLERADSSLFLRYVQFSPLPSTGTYTLELDPPGAAAGSLALTFVLATDQVLKGVPGRPATTSWSVGQETRVRFGVKAGEHVAVDLRSLRSTGQQTVSVALVAPDGSTSTSLQLDPFTPAPQWLEVGNYDTVAPQDGVWELRFSGVLGTTGALTYVIRTAKDQVLVGRPGRATTVEARPAQNVRLTFTVAPGDVGRTLVWSVTGSTFSPAARLWLDGPGVFQSSFVGVAPPGTSSGIGFQPLLEAGTYTFVVDPQDGAAGTAKVTFSLVG